MSTEFRVERDTMGETRVPAEALYGAQTARAIENFPIGGPRFPRAFLRALGTIKSAAARINAEMGFLDPTLAGRIERAAWEVAEGRYDGEFPLDIFQTGSGTSTNMNANEVIGRLAGAHPNDHVNRGQSSNDVIPSAMHVSAAKRRPASCCRPWKRCKHPWSERQPSFTASSRSAAPICKTRRPCAWARNSAATRGRWRRRVSA